MFRSKLEQFLPLLEESKLPPMTGTIDAALEVLRVEREKEKAQEEDDSDGIGDSIGAATEIWTLITQASYGIQFTRWTMRSSS